MAQFRRITILLLTLALVLVGAQSAVARAEMAAASYPVLCGDHSGQIAVDVMGNPVAHRHACPHCLAASGSLAVLDAPVAGAVLALGRATLAEPMAPLAPVLILAAAAHPARGPPRLS